MVASQEEPIIVSSLEKEVLPKHMYGDEYTPLERLEQYLHHCLNRRLDGLTNIFSGDPDRIWPLLEKFNACLAIKRVCFDGSDVLPEQSFRSAVHSAPITNDLKKYFLSDQLARPEDEARAISRDFYSHLRGSHLSIDHEAFVFGLTDNGKEWMPFLVRAQLFPAMHYLTCAIIEDVFDPTEIDELVQIFDAQKEDIRNYKPAISDPHPTPKPSPKLTRAENSSTPSRRVTRGGEQKRNNQARASGDTKLKLLGRVAAFIPMSFAILVIYSNRVFLWHVREPRLANEPVYAEGGILFTTLGYLAFVPMVTFLGMASYLFLRHRRWRFCLAVIAIFGVLAVLLQAAPDKHSGGENFLYVTAQYYVDPGYRYVAFYTTFARWIYIFLFGAAFVWAWRDINSYSGGSAQNIIRKLQALIKPATDLFSSINSKTKAVLVITGGAIFVAIWFIQTSDARELKAFNEALNDRERTVETDPVRSLASGEFRTIGCDVPKEPSNVGNMAFCSYDLQKFNTDIVDMTVTYGYRFRKGELSKPSISNRFEIRLNNAQTAIDEDGFVRSTNLSQRFFAKFDTSLSADSFMQNMIKARLNLKSNEELLQDFEFSSPRCKYKLSFMQGFLGGNASFSTVQTCPD